MRLRIVGGLVGMTLAVVGCAENAPGSIAVAETLDDVRYYYACGNEILSLPDGRAFFPLVDEEQESFDESLYAQAAALELGRGLVAVVPPGPGDDTGTLTIYLDGMAHWTSDTGIEAWLTDEPQHYDWVC